MDFWVELLTETCECINEHSWIGFQQVSKCRWNQTLWLLLKWWKAQMLQLAICILHVWTKFPQVPRFSTASSLQLFLRIPCNENVSQLKHFSCNFASMFELSSKISRLKLISFHYFSSCFYRDHGRLLLYESRFCWMFTEQTYETAKPESGWRLLLEVSLSLALFFRDSKLSLQAMWLTASFLNSVQLQEYDWSL